MLKVLVKLTGLHAPIEVQLTDKMAGNNAFLTFREFIDVCLLARITRKMREVLNPFVELLSMTSSTGTVYKRTLLRICMKKLV